MNFLPFLLSHQLNIPMQIAFLGLGIMGSRMSHNLLAQYPNLTVWNRSPEPSQPLGAAGAQVAENPAAAVEGADLVITMLARPEAVASVAWGEDGFLSQMKPGSLWLDCSTVDPAFSREAAQRAHQHQLRMIDAPVAGSKPQAEAAELAFFVGGEADAVAEVQPVMEQMGRKVIHVGPQSQGCAFKMLVNAMLAQSMVMFAESVQWGEKLGLGRDFLLDTLPKLPIAAPFLQAKADKIKQDDYEVQFPLELMHKDLHLADLSAYQVGQPLYLANLAKSLYGGAARDPELARLDFAAIFRFLEGK